MFSASQLDRLLIVLSEWDFHQIIYAGDGIASKATAHAEKLYSPLAQRERDI